MGKIVPNSGDLTNGMGLTAEGYPRGGFNGQAILPQPRLGFTWDVTGDRQDGAARRLRDLLRPVAQRRRGGSGATNQPFVFNPTLTNGYLQDITSGGAGALAPQTVQALDPDGKQTAVYSYSVGVQRDLGKGIVVDVAYVGSQSRHNPRRVNLNLLPYGTTFQASAQDPTKTSGVVPAVEPSLPAAHRDAGLSFSGRQRLRHRLPAPVPGLQRHHLLLPRRQDLLQLACRWRCNGASRGASPSASRTPCRGPGRRSSDEGTLTSNLDPAAYDYGLATFDRTHYFVANYIWNLPKGGKLLGGGWLARALLDNWTISGISWATSGNPPS